MSDKKNERRGLGRGLSALMADVGVADVGESSRPRRADLSVPVESLERFGHTQERLAEALSKSRSHIANLLRLLTLPDEVQHHLREGRLSAGHARALITTPDPAALARQVIAKGLSVRETEALARKAMAPKPDRPAAPRAEKDADTKVLERDLSAALGMSVSIDHRGHDGGVVTIRYRDLDQLDRLCQHLGGM